MQRLLLPLLNRPSINRRLTARVSQIDVGYHDGPLADDELSGGRIRPGGRAPDAHLFDAATGQPLQLFDLPRGPRWTLLLVGDASASRLDCDALLDAVHTCLITPARSTSFSGRVVIDPRQDVSPGLPSKARYRVAHSSGRLPPLTRTPPAPTG